MTSTRTLAELDQPYRDAESRLTALICGPQGRLTAAQHAERSDAIAAAIVDLRAIVNEMQLAVYREPSVPMALGMALRHALSGLEADAAFWRKSAADHRADVAREQAATKLAIMRARRIEIDGEVVAP